MAQSKGGLIAILALRNAGTETLPMPGCNDASFGEYDYKLSIESTDGKEPDTTDQQKLLSGRSPKHFMVATCSEGIRDLPANAIQFETVALAKNFILTPGKSYVLSAERTLYLANQQITIHSDRVEFIAP